MRRSEPTQPGRGGGVRRAGPARIAGRRDSRKPALTAVVVVAVLLAAAVLWAVRPWAAPGAGPAAITTVMHARVPAGAAVPVRESRAGHPAPGDWRQVLARLDSIRGRAWLHQAPGLLRRVYVPGARVQMLDRAMLAGYRQRGLRVRGVDLTFARVRLRSRSPGRVRLDVVDTLGPMTALGRGGRQALPRDNASRHVLVLARVGAQWRIASILAR